jgi:hypothetical protein
VALVRTDVLEECILSIISVTRIGDSSHPDNGEDTFHQNIGFYKSHMAKHPRRWYSS